MKFRMLGPLEADDNEQPLGLGGTKQRATLGFLLLQANRVVSTSQLVKALWPVDEAPTSARKILHNAVWGLRRVLASNDCGEEHVALLSQAPGYLLKVDPEQVDLYRFNRMTEAGRAELAAGSLETGTTLLRDALALWRGPALADLVETGVAWPELAVVQNARLDAVEDYFDAELERGNHLAVLGELETMAESRTLRERSCGQLMLALYRCGRQADALNVYSRVRASLIEELGLEPGRGLQMLQHAILTHDPSLTPAGLPARDDARIEVRSTGALERQQIPTQPDPPAEVLCDHGEVERPARHASVTSERKQVSVLIIRTELGSDFAEADSDGVDEVRESVSAAIRETVECLGGTVAASIGSVSLALFGVSHNRADDAERAVCAALAVRGSLTAVSGSETSPARALTVHAAVTTGEARVRIQIDGDGARTTVNGVLLDECQALLARVPPGEIQVCDRTRRSTQSTIIYRLVGDPSAGWQVGSARQEHIAPDVSTPLADREWELDMLLGMLDRAQQRSVPQLVTLLGESGVGKTRFMAEFEQQVASRPAPPHVLVGTVAANGTSLVAQAQMLRSHCGILPGDSAAVATDKLEAAIGKLVPSPQDAEWLLVRLGPLVAAGCGGIAGIGREEVLDAWGRFVREIALDRPLVLIVDNLHDAHDAVLDFVENLAEHSEPLPLLVIAAAQPVLLDRRPGWGGGKRHTTTITLEPVTNCTVEQMVDSFMSTLDQDLDARTPLLGGPLSNVEECAEDRGKLVSTLLRSDQADLRWDRRPMVLPLEHSLTARRR